MDGSGLKMPCTTLKGRKAVVLAGSASYLGFLFCSSLEVGAQCREKILPGDLLRQTCASCFWLDLWLAPGVF